MQMEVEVKVTGPMLRGMPAPVMLRAIEGTVREVVDTVATRLDDQFQMRPKGVYLTVEQAGKGKASTGHYRRSIHQQVQGLHGRIDDSRVVYGAYLEGISSRNQRTRFKGYSVWRRTVQWGQKRVPGILRAHIGKAIRLLGS